MTSSTERRRLLAEARRALGTDQLVLLIHDASFPGRADEDTGRGSPYTRGARDLLEWALDQGFTGIQLGPQGDTSATDPSPYDGTAFAKSVLSLPLGSLARDPKWEGIFDPRDVEAIVAGAPAARGASDRVDYSYVFAAHRSALRAAFARLDPAGEVARRFAAFQREHAWWLDHDVRWEAAHPGGLGPDLFAFGQFVVHACHAELLAFAERAGLSLFGDLQVGLSARDLWDREPLFFADYFMGAPPSRTNPDGQPWGYAVLDPRAPGALDFLRARVTKMLQDFHGLRIDHPHGLVCPWVYDAHAADALRAVQSGARLFESPDLPDHPALAALAIARPDQIDRDSLRYADAWVRSLDDAQVDVYARQIEIVMQAARTCGRATDGVFCEVLSTCPYPLARVLGRYGLGRFRVTQKAKVRDPTDVYRTDQARPEDWVMLGNHDTLPIWRVVSRWPEYGVVDAWGDYLEARLGPRAVDRAAIQADPAALAQPMFADLFACAARHVAVFFADLLGSTEIYNMPGVVHPSNWTLRTGNDFASVHAERSKVGRALDVPRALATALRARHDAAAADLADRVEALSA